MVLTVSSTTLWPEHCFEGVGVLSSARLADPPELGQGEEEGQAAVVDHPTRTGKGGSPEKLGCREDRGSYTSSIAWALELPQLGLNLRCVTQKIASSSRLQSLESQRVGHY